MVTLDQARRLIQEWIDTKERVYECTAAYKLEEPPHCKQLYNAEQAVRQVESAMGLSLLFGIAHDIASYNAIIGDTSDADDLTMALREASSAEMEERIKDDYAPVLAEAEARRQQARADLAQIDARITTILHTVPDQPEEQVRTDEDVADMVYQTLQWLAVEIAPVVQLLINVGVKEEDICRYLGLTKKEEVRMTDAKMYAIVKIATESLTDMEMNAHYTKALSGFGTAKALLGYAKIAHLYTEQDETEMRPEVREAFIMVARERLGF